MSGRRVVASEKVSARGVAGMLEIDSRRGHRTMLRGSWPLVPKARSRAATSEPGGFAPGAALAASSAGRAGMGSSRPSARATTARGGRSAATPAPTAPAAPRSDHPHPLLAADPDRPADRGDSGVPAQRRRGDQRAGNIAQVAEASPPAGVRPRRTTCLESRRLCRSGTHLACPRRRTRPHAGDEFSMPRPSNLVPPW